MFNWFRKFFLNYLWIGIVLILIAIILDLMNTSPDLYISIFIRFLESVGIAILVAAVFTFASGTSEFIAKIRRLLQDIVVSRKFLGNISTAGKQEALRSIIRPSEDEQRIYSNVEDFYETYINKILSVSKTCVRSDYQLHCRVWYDSTKKLVRSQQTITYRLYPTKDGFSVIKLAFDDNPWEEVPVCDHLIVSGPNGEILRQAPWELKLIDRNGRSAYEAIMDLEEIGSGLSHLNIEIRTTASEHRHWASLGYQALQPTDGLRYHLQCEDGITVKSVQTFSHGVDLKIDKISDAEMFVRCSQWIHEGAGVAIIVSRNENSDQIQREESKDT